MPTQNESKEYIGSTGGPFKKKYCTHISDIRNEKSKGTELSKYIWKLKTSNKSYELRLEFMHKTGELKDLGKTCKTCNFVNKERSLNKKQELFLHMSTL